MRTFLILILLVQFIFAQGWRTFNKETSPLPENEVRAISIDKNGNKWFATPNFLTQFDGTNWTSISTVDSLILPNIQRMAYEVVDKTTFLWLGTESGISKMTLLDTLVFWPHLRETNSGLISNNVLAIAIDEKHVKWFGTNKGLSAYDGQNWKSFTFQDYLYHNVIQAIGFASNGWKYLGTKGGGVSRLKSDGLDAVTSASPYDNIWSGLLSDTVNAVFIDSADVQWFGTKNGLSIHIGEETKKNWTLYTIDEGLVNNFITVIREDSNGIKWIGTQGGVSRFDGKSWINFTKANGLAGNIVNDIAIDLDGSIWFATDNGLSWFDNKTAEISSSSPSPLTVKNLALKGYPNPFNAEISIEVTVETPGLHEISIYNLLGHKIHTLLKNQITFGQYRLKWNGENDQGQGQPSGIYFIRAQSESALSMIRIVMLK